MIDEDCVQWLVEQFFRYRTFEFVESQIQEFELRELQHHFWELASEAVVTEIQFEQKYQILELVWHSTTKPV